MRVVSSHITLQKLVVGSREQFSVLRPGREAGSNGTPYAIFYAVQTTDSFPKRQAKLKVPRTLRSPIPVPIFNL